VTQATLSGEEWRLIEGLREIPRGGARDELLGLVHDLFDLVREPRCAESQADGVPCATVDMACEDCRHVASVLALLHRRLLATLH
jgi:hypothetical protein